MYVRWSWPVSPTSPALIRNFFDPSLSLALFSLSFNPFVAHSLLPSFSPSSDHFLVFAFVAGLDVLCRISLILFPPPRTTRLYARS